MKNIQFISCDQEHRYIKKLGEEFLDIEFTKDYDHIEKSDKTFILWNPYGFLAHDKKTYHKKYSLYRRLREEGKDVYIVERGALPNTIFIDKNGFLCESDSYDEKHWDHPLTLEQKQKALDYIDWLKGDEHTLEPQKSKRLSVDNLREKLGISRRFNQIVFIPFQIHNDTVTILWSDWVGTTTNFVKHIQTLISNNLRTLFLIKNHPNETEDYKVRIIASNVRMVDDVHYKDCLEVCDKVIVINSGVGLQAMCWGKPVAVCGKAFYQFSDINTKIHDEYELQTFLEYTPNVNPEKVKRFIYYLTNEYYTECTMQKVSRNTSVPKLIKNIRMPKPPKKKLKILYPFNEYGWAFEFEAQNYEKYSDHTVVPIHYNPTKFPLKEKDYQTLIGQKPDIIVIPSAWHYYKLGDSFIARLRREGIRMVVQYNSHYEPKYFCKESDLVMTSSEKLYKILQSKYKYHNIIKQHHFVDTNRFTFTGANSNIVGWVGRFDNPIKRSEILFKLGCPILIKSNYHNFLNENRSHDEMKEFYDNIGILLITSEAEGSPYPLLEAMACGKVVLATDVGICNEILSSECIVYENNEEEIIKSFIEKLNYFQKHPEQRIEIGKRNYQYILDNLEWKSKVNILDDIYTELINTNNVGVNEKLINPNTFNGILETLLNEKINFWLTHYTCLTAVCSSNLPEDITELYIGTDNFKIKSILTKYGWKKIKDSYIKDNLTIYVEISTPINTKIRNLNGREYKVPLPVVGYLENLYGKNWKERYENKSRFSNKK